MRHPGFPSQIPLPAGSGDPYLLKTLAQWKYCSHNPRDYNDVLAGLESELSTPEMVSRTLKARFDPDDRLRLAALTRIVVRRLPDAEEICIGFLHHSNVWDRELASRTGVRVQVGPDH
jgi:hypothetical protein